MAEEQGLQNVPEGGAAAQANRTKSLIELIKGWPLSRKIALAAVLLISIAVFVIIIIQARTADYQLLYANLDETDASSVVNWLKGQKMPYQLKNNGRNIWIPAASIYETRLDLAGNGLPRGGGVGFEIFDKQSFALTDYVQKVNYTRALQGELSRTIASLSPVESARVHLAIPEKRLFKNQQKPATASVIVNLMAGRELDKKQVQGIVHLVSSSITGLAPKDVTVIDADGVVLDADDKSEQEELLSADMLSFQQEVEKRLEMRAQDLLDKTMGRDKAMVRITATLDFAKVEKTEELFDPEEPVIRSQQTSSESSGGQVAGGIPGVQSNLQGVSRGQGGVSPSANKSSQLTNYEISKTVSKIVNPVGSITKLSVSVLVADKAEVKADGTLGPAVPRTPEELESIRNMVSAALGLVAERGDVINVTSMPFSASPEKDLMADSISGNLLYEYLPYAKIGLICLSILITYFFLVRPIIKTMRGDLQEHYKTVEELEREQLETVKQIPEEEPVTVDDAVMVLRREIDKDPVPAAYIIKNWIQEG
ncbi:MAG: flagellar M-ring protein FliF [Deltaproteobacteria bacterium]|nr:MAG: flagellar M-ring protein FliF [Deltaproteobacteria bacterium]